MKNVLPFLLAIIILGCSKETENVISEKIAPFLGTYEYDGFHERGIIMEFDNEGNSISCCYDTILVNQEIITISAFLDTDTVIVRNLIKSHWNSTNSGAMVKGTVQGSRIVFDYDDSDYYRNDKLKGQLSISGDKLSVNYSWNTSDTYTEGATPKFGRIWGEGLKR